MTSQLFIYSQLNQQQFDRRKLPIRSIIFAQQCVLLPLYFFIPLWIAGLNISIALTILWRDFRQASELSRPIKLLITLSAIAAVFVTFQRFSGRDAGVALIAVMYGLKILEIRKTRDAHLLLSLGFFLLVAGFLFTQKPWIALYQIIPLLAILNALAAMQSLNGERGLIVRNGDQPVNTSGKARFSLSFFPLLQIIKPLSKYLLLGLPVMVILFVFFPRLGGPIWRMPGANSASTGVSDSMTPGDISSLKLSDKIAFRVKFEQAVPEQSQMYWRVLVLDEFDGISWTRGGTSPILDPVDNPSLNFDGLTQYEYDITLEPTNQNFITTLDRPIKTPHKANLLQDFVSYTPFKIYDRLKYSVVSAPAMTIEPAMDSGRRLFFTDIPDPSSNNSRAWQWANNQRQLFNNDLDYIQFLLGQIYQQPYFYTLQPPIMARDMVDSFWFDHKKGFCEHYASALVYMARAVDIPARVVIGYQGAEKNPLSDYWIVREANAHAWTEIWFEGQGWVRIDPTSAIAPHRVEQVLLEDYRQRDSLFDEFDFVALDSPGLLKQFEYWSDQLNNRWNDWILDYDNQRQSQLFKSFGFSAISGQQMVIIMIVLVVLFVLLTSVKWLHQRQKQSPISQAYLKLLTQLDKKKIVVFDQSLGPQALKKQLSQQGAIRYQPVINLLDEYIRIRYQTSHSDPAACQSLIKRFRRLSVKPSRKSARSD